jgi:hypothetical protein
VAGEEPDVNRVRLLAAGTAIMCLGYVAASLIIRPSLLPDAAYGLLVHKSMRQGAPWNHVIEPSGDDIAVDRAYFYAIWSPGQYAVPGLLIDAGLSVGRSIAVVSVVASLGGLAGWLLLYRTLGFDAVSALAATALVAASRSFNHAFVAYVGSDLLAFAVFPLLAVALVKLRDSQWLAPAAATAMLVAFAAKNSLPIYVGAWLVAQSLLLIRTRGVSVATMTAAGTPIAAAAATMAVIHWGYNMRGWTPVSYQPVLSTAAHTYLLPLAMPALAATSWDDVLSWVFSHPAGPVLDFDYKQSVALVGLVAVASVMGAVAAVRRGPRVAWLIAAYSAIVVAAFTVLLSTGSGASLDLSRHYRLVGYVWLPVMAGAALTSRRAIALIVAIAMITPCAYGLASFAANWRRHYARRASHTQALQVTHTQMSPRLVRALAMLDRELPAAALVVTPAPSYALEFERTRTLATSAVSDSIEQLRAAPRRGTVGNLVLFAEQPGMTDDHQRTWLESFVDYRQWESLDLDNHRFYLPAGQPVSASWLRAHFATLPN